jgi:GT2 family glycosyltransferase
MINSNNIDVAIIIVNYNTPYLIIDCVNSIYRETKSITFDICVVDNCSTDNSIKIISQKFPEIKLIALKENLGFSAANNIASNQTHSKYILFLNSDTIFINDCLQGFVSYYESKSKDGIGIIGAKLLNKGLETDVSYGNFPSLWYEFLTLGFHKVLPCIIEKIKPAVVDNYLISKKVDYIIGADMFMSRDIFEKVGGFDNDFFLYYEETYLCYIVWKSGYTVEYVPDISLIHIGGASNKTMKHRNAWLFQQLLTSKFIYFHKVGDFKLPFIILLLEVLKDFIRNFPGKEKTSLKLILEAYKAYRLKMK